MTRGAYLLSLGRVPYREAWDLQRSLAAAVSQGAIPDTVLLLEHPPVITLGRRTDEDELFQSGVAAAAFVDPATNQVLATVPLPVDVGYVAVLDDAVFFPSHGGSTAVVIDRATWTVTATPDLGVATAGGLTATDGARIYVPVSGHRDVVVVDAETFAVVDTIESLGNNAPVLVDGSLWTVDSWDGLMQRHDLT